MRVKQKKRKSSPYVGVVYDQRSITVDERAMERAKESGTTTKGADEKK